jgi:putative acetyltransferase
VTDLRAVAVRAILSAQEAACDVRDEGWGTLVVNPEFHLIHVANYLSLRSLPSGGLVEVLRRMDDAFRPLHIRHRMVFVEDEGLADRMRPEFAAHGFVPQPSHVMAALRPPSLAANPGITLRPARDQSTRDDYDTIGGLIDEESGHDHEVSHQLLGLHWRRVHELGSEAYVAYARGEAVGCATLADVGGAAVVLDISTHPASRGRGVAATMMLHLLERARSRGLSPIVLETPLKDTTVAMYEKLGFDRTGRLDEFLLPG